MDGIRSPKEQFYDQYLAPILTPVLEVLGNYYISPAVALGIPAIMLAILAIRVWRKNSTLRPFTGLIVFSIVVIGLVVIAAQVQFVRDRLAGEGTGSSPPPDHLPPGIPVNALN